MTIERKVGMGIAGQPSGGAADVAEVFSTYLYTGNSGTNAINNGIDLAGEGGMVWFKDRNNANNHYIADTERGASKVLYGLGAYAETTSANSVTSFNSNGFTLGADGTDGINKNTRSQVSWAFRKKSRFFSCVTYSGNGTSQVISHGLDGPVGMIIVKSLTESRGWNVYHKSLGTGKHLELNLTDGENTGSVYITSVGNSSFTVGSAYDVNNNGQSYVAYLFADNSSEDADDQMIKCGSYTGNQSATGPIINLGWEPQWLMVKQATSVVDPADWIMVDNMRGWATGSADARLYANSSGAENNTEIGIDITSTGFKLTTNGEQTNKNNAQYIYMAIRAPMMKEPEAATDVFAVNSRGTTAATAAGVVYYSGFPVDFALEKNVSQVTSMSARNRLNGPLRLQTDNNSAETNEGGDKFGSMNGFDVRVLSTNTDKFAWMWKRAKGYMDAVCYSGSGSASTVPHSLGVVPEMIWTKQRNGAVNWAVYHSGIGNTKHLRLNDVNAQIGGTNFWNNTTPTDTHFTVGTDGETGHSSGNYIAYLFATLAGISKVGSFVGNGSSQTISCGFSAGSRYILIKRTDATGDWYVWDSVRGIVAGNDPHLSLNTSDAQVTTDDSVDPANSGFIVNQVSATNINVSSATYIFYAIA